MEKKKYRILKSALIAFVLVGLLTPAGPLAGQTWEVFDPSLCGVLTLDELGDLVIDASVSLPLPEDGILCYRNFTLRPGKTLTFQRNALNTPVYILAKSIIIDGIIYVNGENATSGRGGRGGPGAFDGGVGGMLGLASAGAGHGPGGGLPGDENSPSGGSAAYGTSSILGDPFKRGETYGHPLLIPLVGGSGGGGNLGINDIGGSGGGGGGAVMLAAKDTVEVNGGIYANPGVRGSGGSTRLVAPTVKGNGIISVPGPVFSGRGDGRIRIDTFDRSDLAIETRGVASLGSFVVAFPDPLPGLDILHVAGEDVPASPTGGVVVQLPEGSNPMQPVRFQTRDFPEPVEVEVVAIPDSGPSSSVTTTVDGSSSVIEVMVEIPANTITHVYAWVR